MRDPVEFINSAEAASELMGGVIMMSGPGAPGEKLLKLHLWHLAFINWWENQNRQRNLALLDFDNAFLITDTWLVSYLCNWLDIGYSSRRRCQPWNVNWWWRVLIAATELTLLELVEERLKNNRRHPTDKKTLLLRQHHASKPDNRSDSTVTAH